MKKLVFTTLGILFFIPVLLFLVARSLALLIPSLSSRATGFAVVLSLTWMLHPLLASTSFHLIQRMTILSGTFSLLGFLLYFHGQHSRLFHFVSIFSMTLRLSLLLKDIKDRMGSTVKVEIGDPMPYESIAHIKDRQKLLDYLRERVYSLSST